MGLLDMGDRYLAAEQENKAQEKQTMIIAGTVGGVVVVLLLVGLGIFCYKNKQKKKDQMGA